MSEAKAATMKSAKEQVRSMLDRLPDGATLEDICYHAYVMMKVEQGRKDAAEGRVYDQVGAKARLKARLTGRSGPAQMKGARV